MRIRFFFFTLIFSSAVFLSGCADFFNEKFSSLNEDYAKAVGSGTERFYSDAHFPDSEGYFIKDEFWRKGGFDETNNLQGEIWSFHAESGHTYAVFASGWNYVFQENHFGKDGRNIEVHMGESEDDFEDMPLTVSLQHGGYSRYYSESESNVIYLDDASCDLLDMPYVFTADESKEIFLKVLPEVRGLSTNAYGKKTLYRDTGSYRICVRDGRNGNEYADLKFHGIPLEAWSKAELLFANAGAWHDYTDDCDYDWVDSHTWSFTVKKGASYKILVDGKPDSDGKGGCGKCTASVLITPYFKKDGSLNSLVDETYRGNDSYHEGYPFVAPIDGDVFVSVSPADNSASNLGTYRIAVTEENQCGYVPTELYSSTYKYRYRPKSSVELSLGSVVSVAEDLELVKYDGSVVPASELESWGWSSSTMKRWDVNLLIYQNDASDSESYIYTVYEGNEYPLYFKVKNPSMKIADGSDSARYYSSAAYYFYLRNNGTNISDNSITWYYADADDSDSDLHGGTNSYRFYMNRFPVGQYYLFAIYNGKIFFKEISVT